MRVGLVGCGRIGRVHAENLAGHPLVSRVEVVDPLGVPRTLAADGVHTTTSVAEAGAAWDAAVVATPTVDHADVVRALLERGVPVLCEKPISLDPVVTVELGRVAEARGVPFRSGLQRRFDPAIVALRRIVEAGELGDLLWVASATRDPVPPATDYIARSGGVFVDMHVHDIDVVVWMLGSADLDVVAMGGGRAEPELDGLDDHGTTTIALRSPTGTLATITGSRWWAPGYAVEMTVLGRRAEVRLEADGSVVLRDDRTTRTIHEGLGSAPKGFIDRFGAAYAAEVAAFLVEVAGGAGAGAGWQDDALAVELAGVAQRSAAVGRDDAVDRRQGPRMSPRLQLEPR